MEKKSSNQFKNVILFGVSGIIVGMLLGFIFGALIVLVVKILGGGGQEVPPLALGMFLGMGVGSTVGGVFGGVIGYKK